MREVLTERVTRGTAGLASVVLAFSMSPKAEAYEASPRLNEQTTAALSTAAVAPLVTIDERCGLSQDNLTMTIDPSDQKSYSTAPYSTADSGLAFYEGFIFSGTPVAGGGQAEKTIYYYDMGTGATGVDRTVQFENQTPCIEAPYTVEVDPTTVRCLEFGRIATDFIVTNPADSTRLSGDNLMIQAIPDTPFLSASYNVGPLADGERKYVRRNIGSQQDNQMAADPYTLSLVDKASFNVLAQTTYDFSACDPEGIYDIGTDEGEDDPKIIKDGSVDEDLFKVNINLKKKLFRTKMVDLDADAAKAKVVARYVGKNGGIKTWKKNVTVEQGEPEKIKKGFNGQPIKKVMVKLWNGKKWETQAKKSLAK